MMMCTTDELSRSLAKLTRAFGEDRLTVGCRLEIGLNILRTAMREVDEPEARMDAVGHLIRELLVLPAHGEAQLPAPTTHSSSALH